MTVTRNGLSLWPEGLDGALGQRAGGVLDDELGDGDDRRAPHAEHHGGEVAGRQAGDPGHHAGDPPGVPRGPHVVDCGSGMIGA